MMSFSFGSCKSVFRILKINWFLSHMKRPEFWTASQPRHWTVAGAVFRKNSSVLAGIDPLVQIQTCQPSKESAQSASLLVFSHQNWARLVQTGQVWGGHFADTEWRLECICDTHLEVFEVPSFHFLSRGKQLYFCHETGNTQSITEANVNVIT